MSLQQFAQMGGRPGKGQQQDIGHAEEISKPDTAEQIYISSLALLKMLKHARAGVPLEVMGLMIG